jgi:hypothetical protein
MKGLSAAKADCGTYRVSEALYRSDGLAEYRILPKRELRSKLVRSNETAPPGVS